MPVIMHEHGIESINLKKGEVTRLYFLARELIQLFIIKF